MVYVINHMVHKHKDPTHHDFWHPPLYWELKPECEILMFTSMWSVGPLIAKAREQQRCV